MSLFVLKLKTPFINSIVIAECNPTNTERFKSLKIGENIKMENLTNEQLDQLLGVIELFGNQGTKLTKETLLQVIEIIKN